MNQCNSAQVMLTKRFIFYSLYANDVSVEAHLSLIRRHPPPPLVAVDRDACVRRCLRSDRWPC